ncbi:hypothetical protein B1808_03575 [Pseudofulvimonas gallinarii]|nr:hypothetical protein B1808_03575 [Pseudofulvimonas gallinarii]
MPVRRLLLAASMLIVLAGCALGPARRAQVDARVSEAHAQSRDCGDGQHCQAMPSPFHALMDADDGRHRVLILNRGADALRLRLHLVRAARESIDVQTFIFQDDASSEVLIGELLAAARRGVRVRVLVDQLFSFNQVDRLAQLALAHPNFQLRYFNPTFREARTQAWEYLASGLCCFRRFNQRMHNKLFAIDGRLAIIGGRNYRDSYYDLKADFAYYDREVLVLGPATADMLGSFERFWRHRHASRVAHLADVGRTLLRGDEGDGALAHLPDPASPVAARLRGLVADANDVELVQARFIAPMRTVEKLRFVADLPSKIGSRRPEANAASLAIRELFTGAQKEVLLQTPYLVLDRTSRELFRQHQLDHPDMRVRVSTNSLAATDAYPVYALSYKYKKRYLRELGFQIYEMRPDPAHWPRIIEAEDPGQPPRVSLHGKSAVVDRRIALVGTHNFDPRSDRFNTEAAVIIEDTGFAAELAQLIERDMEPANSWIIAPRERGPMPVYWLSRTLENISSALPVFDLWPFRYASSFQPVEGCPPLAREHPDFYRCHEDVGDFPGVENVLARIRARLVAAFGAPMVPIL